LKLMVLSRYKVSDEQKGAIKALLKEVVDELEKTA